jgi:hypothetical protein
MGRKSNAQKAAEAAAAQDQIDQSNGDAATATAEAPAVAPEFTPATITMTDFQALENRADFVSIRDGAKRVFGDAYDPKNDQTIRNAAKKRDEFRQPGMAYSVTVEGYDIPPLTYLNVAALDLYVANNAAGVGTGRAGKNGTKREIVRPTAEQRAHLENLFATDPILAGMQFEPASTPKKTKKQLAAEAAASVDTSAPADEGAHETAATDASADEHDYDGTYAANGIGGDDTDADTTDADKPGALEF